MLCCYFRMRPTFIISKICKNSTKGKSLKRSTKNKMAKFMKSIFSPPAPEKSKSIREHAEHEGESDSPIGDRRKLSMSRSGRLKHSYKKRHSLSMELYGNEDDMQQTEKPKSVEYHVHQTSAPSEPKETNRRKSVDSTVDAARKGSISPEEEIDSAFEIIDKS